MRKVLCVARRVVPLVAVGLVLSVGPNLRADDPAPYQPPAAIIRPPVGGNGSSQPPTVRRFLAWVAAQVITSIRGE